MAPASCHPRRSRKDDAPYQNGESESQTPGPWADPGRPGDPGSEVSVTPGMSPSGTARWGPVVSCAPLAQKCSLLQEQGDGKGTALSPSLPDTMALCARTEGLAGTGRTEAPPAPWTCVHLAWRRPAELWDPESSRNPSRIISGVSSRQSQHQRRDTCDPTGRRTHPRSHPQAPPPASHTVSPRHATRVLSSEPCCYCSALGAPCRLDRTEWSPLSVTGRMWSPSPTGKGAEAQRGTETHSRSHSQLTENRDSTPLLRHCPSHPHNESVSPHTFPWQ